MIPCMPWNWTDANFYFKHELFMSSHPCFGHGGRFIEGSQHIYNSTLWWTSKHFPLCSAPLIRWGARAIEPPRVGWLNNRLRDVKKWSEINFIIMVKEESRFMITFFNKSEGKMIRRKVYTDVGSLVYTCKETRNQSLSSRFSAAPTNGNKKKK